MGGRGQKEKNVAIGNVAWQDLRDTQPRRDSIIGVFKNCSLQFALHVFLGPGLSLKGGVHNQYIPKSFWNINVSRYRVFFVVFSWFFVLFFDVLYGSIVFSCEMFCITVFVFFDTLCCFVPSTRVCFSLSPHRTTLNESMSDDASRTTAWVLVCLGNSVWQSTPSFGPNVVGTKTSRHVKATRAPICCK